MEESKSETQSTKDDCSVDGKSEVGFLEREIGNERSNCNRCSFWWTKLNITIEPAMFAIFLAINLCEIVIANLIMDRTCTLELHLNRSECSLLGNNTEESHRVEALVQPYASLILTLKSLLSSIVPAILSLFSGPWSDANGRKFLLLLPMIGLSLSLLMYGVLAYFTSVKPAFFLLAALPFSFSGGFINLLSAAYAYISDISSEESRALRLSLLEGSLFIGLLMGTISSYRVFKLDQSFGYIIILAIGSVICLVAFLYTMFFVPESVDCNNQSSGSGKNLFQLRFIKETFATSFKRRENNGRTLICLMLVVMTLTISAMEGESNLLYLFTRLNFGWNYPQYMTYYSIYLACHFIGLMLGCTILIKVLKISDNALVIGSFVMKIGQTVFYGLIPSSSGYLMYWAQMVGMFGGVVGPALRSIVSKLLPKEDVGKVFFLVTSMESLFPLGITPIYTALYNVTIKTFPGAFFFLSASLYALNLGLCCIVHFLQKRGESNYNQMNER